FPEITNQMEEPKEISNNKNAEQLDVYNVASPRQHVKKDIAEKLYQVLSFSESSIIQDIDKCKHVKKDIAEKLYQVLSFSESSIIQDIDKCKIDVGTDKKRCHNRLNKGRMDLEYSKQVHAELLLPKKPIVWIQHGNNKRAEEAKLYHEIKIKRFIEISHRANTLFNEIGGEKLAMESSPAKGYKQQAMKNIKCMERELEEISSLRKKAYKCAYKQGDQQNEVKSSYTEYQSLMKYVKELARRGDTHELMKICHRQLFE
ncbi:hypothetical protein Tco_0962206, partial [Tanacetum coccineum]